MFFLNLGNLSELVEGKKEFLKKLCLTLRMRILGTVLTVYAARLTRFKCEWYSGCLVFKTTENKDVSSENNLTLDDKLSDKSLI